jgi:hypothetical protein
MGMDLYALIAKEARLHGTGYLSACHAGKMWRRFGRLHYDVAVGASDAGAAPKEFSLTHEIKQITIPYR